MPKQAVIIGGGVVGLSCACELANNGHRVRIVEREPLQRGASWGNAGHIAAEQVEPLASMPMIRAFPRRMFAAGGPLSLPPRQIAQWLPFSAELAAAARPRRFSMGRAALSAALGLAVPAWERHTAMLDAPALLRKDGHFVIWESAASARAGRGAWDRVAAPTSQFRDATGAELSALSAMLHKPPAGAVRFRSSGQLDPRRLAQAQRDFLAARGADFIVDVAAALETRERRCRVRLKSGRTLSADLLVVSAGTGSGALMKALGYRVPIIAERGYHIETPSPDALADWPADMPPLVFEDRSMIVTRFDNAIRAASFVEFGSADAPPDPRKWARLRSHVRALGLPFALPGRQWLGARPTLPDYLPAIGRAEGADNLIYAFGHQHLGLTLSALTGELVAAMAAGSPPRLDPAPFSLARFQKGFRK